MLNSIKQLVVLKSIDNLINSKKYDLALEKLNLLIQNGFSLKESYLKRGQLCHKLLMNEEAYSDFTYVITHYADNQDSLKERMVLNFEISNFHEAIYDAEQVILFDSDFFEAHRIKFLSLVFSDSLLESKDYIYNFFQENKYKTIQFLLNETALVIAKDELAKGLKILEVVELLDRDNPMKLLKEACIYGIAGDTEKQESLIRKIDSIFPKYFISHFKFGDIYEDRDILEICFLLELKVFDKQKLFDYPMSILEGYKYNTEGRILDSKECFERAIEINPEKPEAYVLLAETLQLLSGYDNRKYREEAEKNYKIALKLYEANQLYSKAEVMKRQIQHLHSSIVIGK